MDEAEIRRKLCEILGAKPNATDDEIKQAYAAEVKKWHPDRVQHNSELAALAEQKLKLINQTYECLTDRVQFEMYAAKLVKKQAEAATGSDHGSSKKTSGTTSGKTSENTSNNGSSTNSNSAKATASSTAPRSPQPTDKGGIVKIFLATGLFVLIVIVVANLTSPRRDAPLTPGVVLSPSESPAAPISSPPNYQRPQNTLPPDSSVGPPPGSN
jgi:curved DNA-binding protein CbpA